MIVLISRLQLMMNLVCFLKAFYEQTHQPLCIKQLEAQSEIKVTHLLEDGK